MKRLKKKLLNLQPKDNTYTSIYEGAICIVDGYETINDVDNTYWQDDTGYVISHTHKLALDKPTITIQIPLERFRVDNCEFPEVISDYCLRAFKEYIDELNKDIYNRARPDKENGKYILYEPIGQIIQRNSAYLAKVNQRYYEYGNGDIVYAMADKKVPGNKVCVCIMLQVQLPYEKHRKTIEMLTKDLPSAVNKFIINFNVSGLEDALSLAKTQRQIREWLKKSNYCSFIANGSILPRSKGTDLPLKNAIPFKSTPDDEIEVFGIYGMGIKRGVTVITGGGYSGKSTLLDAVSGGIYNHVRGDGREFVITDDSAIKISAEDGRSVKNVNISPFIKWIPNGDTRNFTTEHASGSTSQAANIMEAINANASLLLIDEDKSATNFMIRDSMMKQLIEKEPITPFTDRVNELYERSGVSTILVIGGSGEYLSVADKIYKMDDYLIQDVTKLAKHICKKAGVFIRRPREVEWRYKRILSAQGFTSYPEDCGTERLEVSDMGFVFIGDERIDVRNLHNIVTKAQLNAIGFMLRKLEVTNNEDKINLEYRLDELYNKIEHYGLEYVFTSFFTTCERFLDLPRKSELMAVINRMRNICFIREDFTLD